MSEFDYDREHDAAVADDHLHRAVSELGEPEVMFQVSPARFLAKLTVGCVLLLYGLVANYLWWVHGPARFGHFEFMFLVVPPATGVALFWHMYRNRALHVLIYPTGLLRLRRGEVDSFPWADIRDVRLKVQRAAAAAITRDESGNPAACALPADVPSFKLWDGGLTVSREDGVSANFGPALSDYPRLAEEVQRRTFAVLWPVVWDRFRAGVPVVFEDLELSASGLRFAQKFLAWKDVKELAVAQNKLSIKQHGKWLPWYLKDASAVPNPHVLFALIEEARRFAPALATLSQPQVPAADHQK
jgi:hypothetical protein